MTTYAITGAHGFLGWHLRCRLKAEQPEAKVRALGRGDLDDAASVADALDGCDVVFHLAAVNSHEASAAAVNRDLAEALVAGLERVKTPPHVVFSNSLHVQGGSPFGQAKRASAGVLSDWTNRASTTLSDVILPNLFGEMSRPHYNSAVATFCHAIATGTACEVNPDGRTELLHAQDAAAALLSQADAKVSGVVRIEGETVAVAEVYDRLARFHETYSRTHSVPFLGSRLDLRLFNQLRCAIYEGVSPVALVSHADNRGRFFEAVRAHGAAQTSFSTTHPGVVRGEHWHRDKIERFLVLHGQATIEIRRLFDDTVRHFEVSGEEPAFLDMPTLHVHNITNTGHEELLTMFWSNDHFSPDAPDTWAEPVRPASAPEPRPA